MIPVRYADIDLSNGQVRDYPLSENVVRMFLGGKGLAAYILYQELAPGIDPLSADNVLILNTTPLTGTGAPCTSRFNASSKNVLTGGIASSNCGGTFGVKLRRAGYDGLIIRGKAPHPCCLMIMDGQITITDAQELWGLNTEETQHHFDRKYGCVVIGPAGENLVRYACAVSGERVLGRCGIGAVMGSKNLKAVVAYGTKSLPINDPKSFRKNVQKWVQGLQKSPTTGNFLPRYGTAFWMNIVNRKHMLPTLNAQQVKHEEAEQISGEYLTENYLTRNSGCVSCQIRCERRVMRDNREIKGPEYETLGLLGANLGITSVDWINEWNYQSDLLGMDTMSMGFTLSLAMEMSQRGIKDFGIDFNQPEAISLAIEKIAHREAPFDELGEGSAWLARKYGTEAFAMQVKGLEMAAYDPRQSQAQGLGYATANRGGCHLGGGYPIYFEALGPIEVNGRTVRGKAALTVLMQNLMDAISTSGYCLFTALGTLPPSLFKFGEKSVIPGLLGKIMLSIPSTHLLWKLMPGLLPINLGGLLPHPSVIRDVTGRKMTIGQFLQMGERVYNMERVFNTREGFDRHQDCLPARLVAEPSEPDQADTVVQIDKMLDTYYHIREWSNNGIPTQNKLKQLEIIA
jgi:aldehyde:ferredoxin oxidoreductase